MNKRNINSHNKTNHSKEYKSSKRKKGYTKKWKSLQTFISKKLKSIVKSLKQDITYMPLSKLPFLGVEMEDALSSHIWPSGILVKKFFYGWNNQQPTTLNDGTKK